MKIKILRKNILKENCGVPAEPLPSITPSEEPPVAGDVTQMSPEEAFDAGYSAAVDEIMAMLGEMMPGGVPIDMAIPAELADVDQLQE
jgi:hypothetical protein